MMRVTLPSSRVIHTSTVHADLHCTCRFLKECKTHIRGQASTLQSEEEHCLWCEQVYFPNIFDIKYLMKFCGNLHGGLNKLAESLEVKRLGPQHQVDFVPCMSRRERTVLSMRFGADSEERPSSGNISASVDPYEGNLHLRW